jgi:hypothetical protein
MGPFMAVRLDIEYGFEHYEDLGSRDVSGFIAALNQE